jgi:hypothetical protein
MSIASIVFVGSSVNPYNTAGSTQYIQDVVSDTLHK